MDDLGLDPLALHTTLGIGTIAMFCLILTEVCGPPPLIRESVLPMNVKIQEKGEFTLATVDGPLDDDAMEVFRQHLHPLIHENSRFVLDLSNSPRVNSEALSALVKLKADANMKGASLIFAAPTPFVEEVIRITQLNSFFDVSESLDEAVSRISK